MGLLNIKARKEGYTVAEEPDHWLNAYMRIPYKDKGRTFEGADCWGWVRLIFHDLQPQVDLAAYDTISAKDSLRVADAIASEQARKSDSGPTLWSPVRRQDVRPFDLVLMYAFWKDDNNRWHKAEGHIGLVVDKTWLAHMEDNVGALKQRIDDGNVRARTISFWRHRDVVVPA